MNTTEQQSIQYENPPINEIVCGVLFDSIKRLQTGHFGVLWQKFRPEFARLEEQPPIPPISEDDLNSGTAFPPQRVWFVHKDDNQVIQMQFNRFLHNWRKRRPDDVYPGYETVIENFEKYLSCFRDFLEDEGLGDFMPKRYELTYIDHILVNEGWETLNNLEKVFPNFVSLKELYMLSADIREINWMTAFGLPNDYGQLQLSIRNAQRIPDGRPLLNIEFSAVGNPLHRPIRDWFDFAHEAILRLFSNLISDEIQEQFWRRGP